MEEIELAYAVLPLSDDQYKSIRGLIAIKLEEMCNAFLRRAEKFLERVRSATKSDMSRIRKDFTKFENWYREIVELHKNFDIWHSIIDKVNELMREIRREFYRRV